MAQKNEMPQSEQIECAQILYWIRDFIQRAWIDSLPRKFFVDSPKVAREKARFDRFLRLGLVDEVWKIKEDFHKVVSDVIGSRSIGDLTYADFGIIASRYREWYPHDRLNSEWHFAGYDMRNELQSR